MISNQEYQQAVEYRNMGQIEWEELVAIIHGRITLKEAMAERMVII